MSVVVRKPVPIGCRVLCRTRKVEVGAYRVDLIRSPLRQQTTVGGEVLATANSSVRAKKALISVLEIVKQVLVQCANQVLRQCAVK